jgi:hypothetical protein
MIDLYATGRQSHPIFARASGQYNEKPAVFLKHAANSIRYRPARLDLHKSGIIEKPFKKDINRCMFSIFYF